MKMRQRKRAPRISAMTRERERKKIVGMWPCWSPREQLTEDVTGGIDRCSSTVVDGAKEHTKYHAEDDPDGVVARVPPILHQASLHEDLELHEEGLSVHGHELGRCRSLLWNGKGLDNANIAPTSENRRMIRGDDQGGIDRVQGLISTLNPTTQGGSTENLSL